MLHLSLKHKKAVLTALIASFIVTGGLYADIITVDDTDFAGKISGANRGDTILFDNSYFIYTYDIDNIKDISIAGSGSIIDGDWTGRRIFATETMGNFSGFDSITLQNGYADDGSGGALYVAWDLTGKINGSIFSDNYASWSGGAIYVYNNFAGNITDSLFSYNGAENYGGAIAAANLFSGFITNSTFIYNSAYDENFGGGAILAGTFNATIVDSYFAGNYANNGGAIYAENMDSIIKDTNFIDNYAYGKGGAIYIRDNANLTLYSTDYMLFSGNWDENGNNAIYFEGNNGTLNIVATDGATIEFDDGIRDSAGILSVEKSGNGTLIYNTFMSYKGDTKIHEGALVLNSYGEIAGALEIGDEAALFVNKDYDFTLTNTIINQGSLNINLNSQYNYFAFADDEMQANFSGTLTLSNAVYTMQKDGNYSLVLNGNAISKMSEADSTLKNLTFDGGTLDAGAFDISIVLETLLSVNELNISGGGGTVIINADISGENIHIADDVNLYNITEDIYSPLYRLIYAANGTNIENSELEILNLSYQNLAAADIVQNASVTGKALLGVAAKTESNGVYLGFRLEGIDSLTDVVLDSSDISNNIFDIFLTGSGNFTFTGANQTFIGNYDSDYTGYTLLKNQAYITAISDNAFGYTNGLSLESGTVFDLNDYYQSVGDLNNNGTIYLNHGYIRADGFTLNNGIINLGSHGTVNFNKGVSIGDNSLLGYGYIHFNDDFNITGSNSDLYADIYINSGTLKVNHTDSLGDFNYIQLGSSNANIAFDITNNETSNHQIYGWYGGSLTKEGNGSLTIDGYVNVGLTNILEGALIVNPNNFYSDINISSASNLIFNNNAAAFYNRLSGGGNITQQGSLALYSNSNGFSGIYNINDSSLTIASGAVLGGDIRANNSDLTTYGDITDNLLLNNSEWVLYKNIDIKNLSASNANIYFGGQNDDFSTTHAIKLSIDNLNGNGDFYQRLNIQNTGGNVINSGDIISINNSSYGNYALHFNDKSTGSFSYQKNAALLVAEQNNPNGEYHANFTGQIDIGAFTYTIWQPNSSENNNVYLKASSCSNPACASLAFPNINYAINYINTDTVLQRTGEIDFDRNNKDDFWIKTYTGNLGYSKDYFMIDDIKYYGMNMGIDRNYDYYLLGLTLGYSDTNINYMKGDANSRSYSAGIYALLKNDDKVYLNALIKYQISKNSFNTETTNGFAVNGDGDTSDILFSVEFGKRYNVYNTPFYIEPQIQTVFTHYDDMVIESSNGLQTEMDKFQSIRTRLSALFGYKIKENTNIYLKAGYIKEFENEAASYSFNHGEKQVYKIDDNIFDSAAGITLNTDNYGIYFEGAYQKSGIFDNTKANLGYRYKF
ncbi:MAG: autotransporter outer membrane beta-barrel domain-containing protein [Campylobacteraceae bacterium]|jgi:outer membrane autotransporter protein|nr:autotransporter outer membrane beta-barrel domain-containing protein [Campylobacteraceae bacterium]